MKIIFFVKSTKEFRSQRVDVDHIIESLINDGNEVSIYDTHQRLFMQCNNHISHRVLKLPKVLDVLILRSPVNLLSLFIFCIMNRNKYNISHFLYIREEYLLIPAILLKVSKKNIATVYGSDLALRNIIKVRFLKFFKGIDLITATNLEIIKKSFVGRLVRNKMIELMFPQIRLLSLRNNNDLQKISKLKKNYYGEKIVITVGTNASENEQHHEIIDQLKKINQKSNDLYFVFPLTYGGCSQYVDKINLIIKESFQSNYSILMGIQKEETISNLRLCTDIFVNLRKNDQNASSIFESIFAGSIMITGDWLPYENLKKQGLNFFEINSINELAECISNILKNFYNIKLQMKRNRDIIWENYNPEIDLNKWLNLYASMV